jgi:hypothetical protein
MKSMLFYVLLVFIVSCKPLSSSSPDFDKFDPDKTYRLQLNPPPGVRYYYEVNNESEVELEVDGKNAGFSNKTSAGMTYQLTKDTTSDLRFQIKYDKIDLYTKSGDKETEIHVKEGTIPLSPEETMLTILRDAVIIGKVSATGEVKQIEGFEEMGDKLISGLPEGDLYGRNTAKAQWEKIVGNGVVRKNIDQIFRVFPDSAIHLGDTWRLSSIQQGDFKLKLSNDFTLKAINSEIAIINATGRIKNDNTIEDLQGYGKVTTNFKGEQEARFEMEAKTGMLISCDIRANVNGTITVMGREVPVTIKTKVRMKGKRLNASGK